jgi:formate dehydrogenase subunit gamma
MNDNTGQNSLVQRYGFSSRVLHWVHSAAFFLLFLSGIILMFPVPGSLAAAAWIRPVHYIGSFLFIAVPVLYFVFYFKSAVNGLKLVFSWSWRDLGWFLSAPRYYLLNDVKPVPQGYFNPGQKLFLLLNLVFGLASIVTGGLRFFALRTLSPGLLKGLMTGHDVAFAVLGVFFVIHLFLAFFSPQSGQALRAITGGRVSIEHAGKYHGKWLDELTAKK